MASEKTATQEGKEAAERLLPKLKQMIGAVTKVLSGFAGPDVDKDEISLELTFLIIHAYDRLCREHLPPNVRSSFVDTLVFVFADFYSGLFMDKRQGEFRNYFLEKLDERQTYFAKAGDLFAGRGSRSVVRLFAEMMASFFPNMDVAATADVARELCLSVRGSLIGTIPASVGSGTAEKTRKTIWGAFWILVVVTLLISLDSPRVAATVSALAAAVVLLVGAFTKKASREPDIDPRLAAFEVLLVTNFIHVGFWMAIVSACIWAIVLAKYL